MTQHQGTLQPTAPAPRECPGCLEMTTVHMTFFQYVIRMYKLLQSRHNRKLT